MNLTSRMLSKPKAENLKKLNTAVYGCGLSASGALAIPRFVQSTSSFENEAPVTAKEARFPKKIPYFHTKSIQHISSGFGFSLFSSDSKLYGSGINNRFQIGGQLGKCQDYYISAKGIPIDGEILQISSGRAHSLILTTEGLFAIGENCFGQCGNDPEKSQVSTMNNENRLIPIQIDSEHPITQIHCALDTSFVITSAGEVFSFGLNEDGQCGNGKYGIQWKPSRIHGDASDVKIRKVSGSTDTILAIDENGELFIWGQTEYGQTAGASDDIQLNTSRHIRTSSIGPITTASSTSTSCIATNSKGEVFTWGVGVLGFGPNVEKLATPTNMDQPLFDNKKVSTVFAGNSAMAALNENGRLFVWGENRFSSLGLGHEKRQLFPYQLFIPGTVNKVALGPDHSIFVAY